ncbi:GATA transcription factor [Actinidia chinensis var. chinensis]|uniref:GATA transcription factor n=1 Tax=Actinidia chinensis var. chinensis TaxID=1590841 RepID=A0A2R6PWU2_ACTCC|nr:GATA transcription factor [Actinidia chinensis var. chinensis]
MASVCTTTWANDLRVPVRVTYVNLYKCPESDAEFVRTAVRGGGRPRQHPEGGGQYQLQAAVPKGLHLFEERDHARVDQEVTGSSQREGGSSREAEEVSDSPEEMCCGGEESEGDIVYHLVRYLPPAALLRCYRRCCGP